MSVRKEHWLYRSGHGDRTGHLPAIALRELVPTLCSALRSATKALRRCHALLPFLILFGGSSTGEELLQRCALRCILLEAAAADARYLVQRRGFHVKFPAALQNKRVIQMAAWRVMPSASPEIWGPPTWLSLHYLAEGYPEQPSPPVKRSCKAFLKALPWMLPCDSCGFHFRKFLATYPGGVAKISSCRDALRCFLVDAHNAIRAHTRPDAKPWTPADASEVYATGRAGPAPAPLEWSDGSRLIRSTGKAPAASCSCSPPPSPPSSPR